MLNKNRAGRVDESLCGEGRGRAQSMPQPEFWVDGRRAVTQQKYI